jgi:hypothetical protein
MVSVICTYCKKPLERSPAQIRANKTGRYFHNPEEQTLYLQEHGSWNRGKKVKKGHRKGE